MDTFIQPPIMTNTPREKTDVSNERRISSDSLTEILKGFNRLTFQSTINNYADDHSKINVAKSDTETKQVVATHTSDRKKIKVTATNNTNGNSPHKLLTKQKSQRSFQLSSRRLTKRARMRLVKIEGICMGYVRFSIRRSSWARRTALQVF